MVIVKNVKDFYRHNDQDLRRFMVFKTGIYDKDMIDEALQEFYIRLINTKALETYDEKIGAKDEKSKVFESYIMNLFCWMLPVLKSKNFRYNHNVISIVRNEKNGELKESDVWDYVSGRGPGVVDFIPRSLIEKKRKRHKNFRSFFKEEREKYEKEGCVSASSTANPTYGVDSRFVASMIDINEESKIRREFKHFISYIKRTEPHNRGRKILEYIRYKMSGCSNSEISKLMGVSNTMIQAIKNQAWEKYRIWKEMPRENKA